MKFGGQGAAMSDTRRAARSIGTKRGPNQRERLVIDRREGVQRLEGGVGFVKTHKQRRVNERVAIRMGRWDNAS